MKKWCVIFVICLLVAEIIFLKIHLDYKDAELSRMFNIESYNYYPIDELMAVSGYQKVVDYSYKRIDSNVEIVLNFDFGNNTCTKNEYMFSLEDSYFFYEGNYYVRKDVLSKVLNGSFEVQEGVLTFKSSDSDEHYWFDEVQVVAHAGGAWRNTTDIAIYTNSKDALVQNYDLGHRLFEFDFNLTSDNFLASVHEWSEVGGIKSSYEWGSFINNYETMFLSDILNEMIVNKDMYLILDTKSFNLLDDMVKVQFQRIVDEAISKDETLLKRIVPQIYNEKMYDIIMSIYSFRSIIYTTYANQDSYAQVINFAQSKPEIQVVCAEVHDLRFTDINAIHIAGLKIFVHTINTTEELASGLYKGIDGFYTDVLLPKDYDIYYKYLKG